MEAHGICTARQLLRKGLRKALGPGTRLIIKRGASVIKSTDRWQVMRRAFICAVALSAACGAPPASIRDLTFLTRGECVNTADVAARLQAALTSLDLPTDYQVVDLDRLPTTDPRTGYPTPTLVYRGVDLFGMPEPTPPFPKPT